jgi:O-antigen ligase
MTSLQIIILSVLLLFTRLVFLDLKAGVYTLIFFMPAYLLRFSLGGIPTTALEIMLYILFLSFLWKDRKDLHPRKAVRDFFRQEKFLAWGLVFLFAGAGLSTCFSSDLRTSLGVLKGWFFDPLLFFIVYIRTIRTSSEVRNSILAYIVSAVAVALAALAYAAVGTLTFDGRLRAFYESPNYLAMYLAPALLLGSCLFFTRKFTFPFFRHEKSGVISAGILGMILVALLLTRSYGAILGLGASAALLGARTYLRAGARRKGKLRRPVAVLGALALVVFAGLSWQKYEQIIHSQARSSFHSRLMIWNAAAKMLEDSPLVGIGPGTFQETYLEYQDRFPVPYLEWAVPEPHNTFLAFYLQLGLLGFAGFLLLLAGLGRAARQEDLLFLFLAYFLVHGMVDTLYWKNDLAMIFFLMLGAGYALSRPGAGIKK